MKSNNRFIRISIITAFLCLFTIPAYAEVYHFELKKGQGTVTEAFNVENMFPGDCETNIYNIEVSYNDEVTVYFETNIHPGYQKLSEVLKCRIELDNTLLYEGLMKDITPITHRMDTSSKVTETLEYAIEVYLDTSTGNEYMNQQLYADFIWWIEKEENLIVPPNTSDGLDVLQWGVIAAASAILLLILLRKKEDTANE